MTFFNDLVHTLVKVVELLFQMDSAGSEKFVYHILIILLFSWLTLLGFLFVKHPSYLRKWKYPDLNVIGIVTLFGLFSYSTGCMFLILLFFAPFSTMAVTEPFPSFVAVLSAGITYQLVYCIFASKKKVNSISKEDNYLPDSLRTFIPNSVVIIFCSFFFLLSFITMSEARGVASFLNLHPVRLWFASIGFLLIGIFLLLNCFSKKFSKFIVNFVNKRKLLVFIITLIFWALSELLMYFFP